MSNDLRTSVTIDLQGNLERKAARYEKAMGRFSKCGQRHMRRLSKSVAATGRMLDRAGNRYTALLTGAAGAGAMRMLVGLETRFTRLGIQANKGKEEMDALKREIYDVASAPDIRIDPGQLTSAIEQIVEKIGDLDFARENLRNIALAIQASGAEGASIGAIVAEFKKLGLTVDKEVLTALDTLVTQGKAGAFTLQHLANQGERAVSAFSAMGYEGQEAVQAMGALLQMSRMGTGSAEMATSAYENMLKVIIEKGKELQAAGIEVFDPEKLKAGVEEFRPMPGIIKEIMVKSKGRATILSSLFGSEGYRAITKAAAEYQKTGGFETLDKFLQIQGDGTKLLEDSARAAKT
ncbi:phage tail tape measure protein [Candidatus Vondammii sp. HM_W22]|uniref:phage tail tape measure protein n=1 Tax=Candidatus Vondammii sp. HM_W22 TaxID=2687299 RepID=UPI001F13BDC3|nr:phage tail tape measure protein [Candidatus Vondammii sp. HM_W22]